MTTSATPVTVTGTVIPSAPVVHASTPPPPQQRVYVQETIVITVDDPTSQPAVGKIYIQGLSFIVLLFSFAELVASSLVIHNSSGYYIGGIYVAIIGFLYSVFMSGPNSLLTQNDIGWKLVITWIDWIICLIGMSITAAEYNFVKSLEACATYSSSLSNSCATGAMIHATCSGNSDYYPEAALCEASYVTDNDGDVGDDECSCVTSSYELTNNDDDSGCYSYDHMGSCSDFLDNTPHQLAVCLSFLVLLLIVFLMLIVVLSMARYNPEAIQTRAEREEEQANAGTRRNLNTSLLNQQQYVNSSSAPVVYVTSA